MLPHLPAGPPGAAPPGNLSFPATTGSLRRRRATAACVVTSAFLLILAFDIPPVASQLATPIPPTVTPPPTATPPTQIVLHGTPQAATVASALLATCEPPSLDIEITGTRLSVNSTYAFTDQHLTGTLAYQVVTSGCAGWSVQISASEFTGTAGPATGHTIPATNVTLTSLTTSDTSGVLVPATSGTLDTPRTVLEANDDSASGTFRQSLHLSLTIPGRTLIGTYVSTITITVASGP